MGSAPALSELAPTCKTRSLFWQSTRLQRRVFTTTPEPTLLPFVMAQLSCAASQLESLGPSPDATVVNRSPAHDARACVRSAPADDAPDQQGSEDARQHSPPRNRPPGPVNLLAAASADVVVTSVVHAVISPSGFAHVFGSNPVFAPEVAPRPTRHAPRPECRLARCRARGGGATHGFFGFGSRVPSPPFALFRGHSFFWWSGE